jgi:predicted RNA-binding protein
MLLLLHAVTEIVGLNTTTMSAPPSVPCLVYLGLEMLDNSRSEIGRRRISTHIGRTDLLSVENVESSRRNGVSSRVEP